MEEVELGEAKRAFARWRRERQGHEPVPERLWAKATAAARAHGTTRTACQLRLNHSALKRRLGAGDASPVSPAPAPTFMELPLGALAGGLGGHEATVEVEDPVGFRLRVVLRGATPYEVAVAASALWSRRT